MCKKSSYSLNTKVSLSTVICSILRNFFCSPSGTTIDIRLSQSEKVVRATCSGVPRNVTFFSASQQAKAYGSIVLTEAGMVSSSRASQSEKASRPMRSSPSGSYTFLSFERRLKARLPMVVTVFGMITMAASVRQEIRRVRSALYNILASITKASA